MNDKELGLQISLTSLIDGQFNFRQFYYYIANEYLKTGRNVCEFTYLCNERSIVFLDFKPNLQLIVNFTCFGDNSTDMVNLFAYHSDTYTFSRQHLVYNPMVINACANELSVKNYTKENITKQSLNRFKKVLSNINLNLKERINFNNQLFIDDTTFWNLPNVALCAEINRFPEIELINVDKLLSFTETEELCLATNVYNYVYQPTILLKSPQAIINHIDLPTSSLANMIYLRNSPKQDYQCVYHFKELDIKLNLSPFNSAVFSDISSKFNNEIVKTSYSKADDPNINDHTVGLAVSFLKPNRLNANLDGNFAFLDLKGTLIRLERDNYTKYPKMINTGNNLSDNKAFKNYNDAIEFCKHANQKLMQNVLQKQALLEKARSNLIKEMEEKRAEIMNQISSLYDLEIQKIQNINMDLELPLTDDIVGLDDKIIVI